MAPDIRSYLIRDNTMNAEHKTSKRLKKFTVSEIIDKKKGFINPVRVTFQNGELNTEQASKCSVNFSINDNSETSILVETPSRHVFKDSNCNEKTRETQIIAIRNKKTNKVRLVEIDHAILINSALLAPPKTNAPPPTANSEVRTLTRAFGGKKVAMQLEQREKLNVSSLPIADDVKKAVKDIKVEENTSLNKTEAESILHILPPCNREATELGDVYRIEEILSEPELQALQDGLSNMEENENDSAQSDEFILSCRSAAKKSKENIDVRLAGVLFMETLVKFLRMPSKKLATKKVEVCSFSSVIQNKILNEFCIKTESSLKSNQTGTLLCPWALVLAATVTILLDKKKYLTRPQTMRDKTVIYIIALCLICCNYQVNLKLLAKATAVHFKRISRLAQVVGVAPVTKGSDIFVLKVPLPPLPKSSKGKVQRK